MPMQHKICAGAILLFLAGPNTVDASDRGFYLSGLVLHDDYQDLAIDAGPILGDISLDQSWGYGLAAGFKVASPLRLELEFASRETDPLELRALDIPDLRGALEWQSLMVNAVFDLRLDSTSLVPYLGAGLGLASVDVDRIGTAFFDINGDDDALAWQALIGFSVPLDSQWSLALDARYLKSDDLSVSLQPVGVPAEMIQVEAVSVAASLRYHF